MPECMRHFLGSETSRMFAHPRFQQAYFLTEDDVTPSRSERITRTLLAHVEPGTRLVEKSPANTVRTRFLQAVFPLSSFVAIVRDGRAVAEGIRRKRNYDPERPHLAGLRTSLEEAAVQWTFANSQLLEDAKWLSRIHFVRYESLVARPQDTLGAVCDFLGLPRSGSDVAGFRTDLNEIQIGRLSTSELREVESIQSALLETLGYAAASDVEGARA